MKKLRLTSQNLTTIIVALIGMIGMVVVALINIHPSEQGISLTQTAAVNSLPREQSPTPTPLVIADTSTLVGWAPDFNASRGDNTINKVEALENGIKLTYDVGKEGYVAITKSFDPAKLLDTEGIRFTYQGMGEPNAIEFKLLLRYPKDTDDTTYGILLLRATNTGGQWQEVKVPYRQMSCWWPAANCALHGNLLDKTMVNRLDIVVSNKSGANPGTGWILVRDVLGMQP